MPRNLVKPRVHQLAVERIARAIIRGDYEASGSLPPEAQLCEALSISRSALREAVKVLGGKGLVSPRPRTGTLIRPRHEWNMLDADLLAWSMEYEPDTDMVRSLIEARKVIEPAVAGLAAQRATSEDLAAMEGAYLQMRAAKEARDFEDYNRADKDFHTALLAASHNFVFMQLASTVGAALAYSFKVTSHRSRDLGPSLDQHGEVAKRIRMRDAGGARTSMVDLLEFAIRDLNLPSPDMGAGEGL